MTAPLLSVEASRLQGRVMVKPAYKLTLTEAGWKVRAELKVVPIGTEMNSFMVNVPADWRGSNRARRSWSTESSPDQRPTGSGKRWPSGPAARPGFRWRCAFCKPQAAVRSRSDRSRTDSIGRDRGRDCAAAFPRRDRSRATLTATVPEGLEVRGESRGWEGHAQQPGEIPSFLPWRTASQPRASQPSADGPTLDSPRPFWPGSRIGPT